MDGIGNTGLRILYIDFACYSFHRILKMMGLLHDTIVVILRALCDERGGLGHQTCRTTSEASQEKMQKYMRTK